MDAVEETMSQYRQRLRSQGIDPDNTRVDQPVAGLMRSVLASDEFKRVAKPIFDQDVGLQKETGGVEAYLSSNRADYDDPNLQTSLKFVPYEGKPEAHPSSAATSGMDIAEPDPSQGIPLFEWHPHPINQPGGNLPSEADLERTLQPFGLPGAIWYNSHSLFNDYTTIPYQAHKLPEGR
jgi:hypothetical protein